VRDPLPRIDVRAEQRQALPWPNDQTLVLEVAHDARTSWVAEFDDDRFPIEPTDGPMVGRLRIDGSRIRDRFGLTPLRLVETTTQRTVEVRIDFVAKTHRIEPFAEILLAIAESEFAALLASGGGERAAGGTEAIGSEQWMAIAALLHQAVLLLASSPPKRLVETWGEWSADAALEGRALNALATQPYALIPSTPGPGSFPLAGRHYRVGALAAPILREDHDTPELRFVHVVLEAAIRGADAALARLQRAIDRGWVATELPPHLRSYETIRSFNARQLQQRSRAEWQRIGAAAAELRATRAVAHRYFPVGRGPARVPVGGRSHDSRLRRVRAAYELLRSGGRTESVPLLIESIRSLPALYEIFVLSELDAALLRLGGERTGSACDADAGNFDGPPKTLAGVPFPNRFHYRHPQVGDVVLHYEPRIRAEPHATARLQNHARVSEYFTPDFVLVGGGRVAIMDAKMERIRNATNEDRDVTLARAALKYLHGIRGAGGDVWGLLLLHFTATEAPESYHARMVTPTLRQIPVHPRVDHLTAVLAEFLTP
jgi:hypothetical protein